MRTLVQRLLTVAFPLFLVAVLVAIGFVTLYHGSSDSPSTVGASAQPAGDTATPDYPKGYPVVISRIVDATNTSYPPPISDPPQEYAVQNPVSVWMAIGAGLRYQKEDEAPLLGYGHLHILIDHPLPLPLDTVPTDDTRIDLADGGYHTTLPNLTPGEHTITAVWTNSQNEAGEPVAYARVKLNVY